MAKKKLRIETIKGDTITLGHSGGTKQYSARIKRTNGDILQLSYRSERVTDVLSDAFLRMVNM